MIISKLIQEIRKQKQHTKTNILWFRSYVKSLFGILELKHLFESIKYFIIKKLLLVLSRLMKYELTRDISIKLSRHLFEYYAKQYEG